MGNGNVIERGKVLQKWTFPISQKCRTLTEKGQRKPQEMYNFVQMPHCGETVAESGKVLHSGDFHQPVTKMQMCPLCTPLTNIIRIP